jgi:hypothetical protein
MGDGGRRSASVGYFPTWGLLARIVHSGARSNKIDKFELMRKSDWAERALLQRYSVDNPLKWETFEEGHNTTTISRTYLLTYLEISPSSWDLMK